MALTGFIHDYFFLAIGLCAIGLIDRFVGLAALGRPKRISAAVELIDRPPVRSLRTITKRLLLGPAASFHQKSNGPWMYGYALYHLALFLVIAGYTISAIVLALKVASGVTIPDFHRHIPTEESLSIANLLAFIFGNAEAFPSCFIFGSFAFFFQTVAWVELPLAIIGNICLLYTVLMKRVGSVSRDIDAAACGMRIRGAFSIQHLAVRLAVFCLIATEYIGRMGWITNIVYFHTILALSLLAAFPYTYLVHIPFAPIAIWLAINRARRNAVA